MTFKLNGSFEVYRDPSGNPLISLNRDGSINLVQIDFADGTTQNTAASGGGSVVLAPTGDQTILGAHALILSDAGSSLQPHGTVFAGIQPPYSSLNASTLFEAFTSNIAGSIAIAGTDSGSPVGLQVISQETSVTEGGGSPFGGWFIGSVVAQEDDAISLGVGGEAINNTTVGKTSVHATGVYGQAQERGAGTTASLEAVRGDTGFNSGGGGGQFIIQLPSVRLYRMWETQSMPDSFLKIREREQLLTVFILQAARTTSARRRLQ